MQLIDVAKNIHSLICSLMISIFLSLAIQATIGFSSETCGQENELETGDQKCKYNSQRTWALVILYGWVLVFLIGAIGTCQLNGWIIITHMASFVIFVGVFVGLIIYRMSSDEIDLTESINTISREVIRDKWGIWASTLRWIILIGPITAFTIDCFLVYYFIAHQHI